jgi:ATP-dependent exoDNAse (exonuclease V) beta subunit
LKLDAEAPLGIRRSELIVKDVAPKIVEAGLADYRAWREGSDAAIASGSKPSVAIQTATHWAKTGAPQQSKLPTVEIIEIPRDPNRPSGPRFGVLVHAVLGTVPLDGNVDVIQRLTALQGRTLGATVEEVESAAKVVQTALDHPVMARARQAQSTGHLRREVPITLPMGDDTLVEGVIDLALEEPAGWTIIDFKTDEELTKSSAVYSRQIGLYTMAVQASTQRPASAVLVRL